MEHAKVFEPNLKVDFIVGKDPYLFLYENDREMEAIDLSVRGMLYPLLSQPFPLDVFANVSIRSISLSLVL
jgi:hypothetical protein